MLEYAVGLNRLEYACGLEVAGIGLNVLEYTGKGWNKL